MLLPYGAIVRSFLDVKIELAWRISVGSSFRITKNVVQLGFNTAQNLRRGIEQKLLLVKSLLRSVLTVIERKKKTIFDLLDFIRIIGSRLFRFKK